MFELKDFIYATTSEVLEQVGDLSEMLALQIEYCAESINEATQEDRELVRELWATIHARLEWIEGDFSLTPGCLQGNSYDHGYATDDRGRAIE